MTVVEISCCAVELYWKVIVRGALWPRSLSGFFGRAR